MAQRGSFASLMLPNAALADRLLCPNRAVGRGLIFRLISSVNLMIVVFLINRCTKIGGLFAIIGMFIGILNSAYAQERVALVIGNGGYETADRLPNPPNDATDVVAALKSIGFEVVYGINLSRHEMEDRIRTFSSKMDHASISLFYYSGHGVQVDGRNYLIPTDAKIEKLGDLFLNTIDLQVVLEQMESSKKRANLVFLDSCRDNPFSRRLRVSSGSESRSINVSEGMAPIQSAAGTMIAFATQPDNVAADGSGRNSPFTKAFLNHITEPDTDIAVVMRHIRNDVLASTSQRQIPWDHSSLTDAVILVPKSSNAPTAFVSPMRPTPPAAPPAQVFDMPVADIVGILDASYTKVPNRRAWTYSKKGTTYSIDHYFGKKLITPNGTRLYIVAQGNSKIDCHACGGIIGVFMFEEPGDSSRPPKLLASSPAIDVGSWGTSDSLDIQFAEFGQNYYYGWLIKDSWFGQGTLIENYQIILPVGREFVIAGNVPSQRENGGACTKPSDCYESNFSLKIDTANTSQKLYPLILTRTGKEGGRTLRPQEYRVEYDPALSRYRLPNNLKSMEHNITED
jgi:hypothetical protein